MCVCVCVCACVCVRVCVCMCVCVRVFSPQIKSVLSQVHMLRLVVVVEEIVIIQTRTQSSLSAPTAVTSVASWMTGRRNECREEENAPRPFTTLVRVERMTQRSMEELLSADSTHS